MCHVSNFATGDEVVFQDATQSQLAYSKDGVIATHTMRSGVADWMFPAHTPQSGNTLMDVFMHDQDSQVLAVCKGSV